VTVHLIKKREPQAPDELFFDDAANHAVFFISNGVLFDFDDLHSHIIALDSVLIPPQGLTTYPPTRTGILRRHLY
jgi:hypothetical protein